jgi:hypothetical protein
MIHDGLLGKFKDSCVPFTKFRSHGVRQVMGFLREREDVLKRDVKRLEGEEKTRAELSLREVESLMFYVYTNLTKAK